MKNLLCTILFLIPLNSLAGDGWTREDTYRETTYVALHTVDWLQTRSVAKSGWDNRKELNPILGEAPSVGKLNSHYVGVIIIHYSISHYLPIEYRKAWQYFSLGEKVNAVYGNYRGGIRIKLDF